jgi:hypothetical protein
MMDGFDYVEQDIAFVGFLSAIKDEVVGMP